MIEQDEAVLFPIARSTLPAPLYHDGLRAIRLAEKRERGTPYSLRELYMASSQPYDEYHRHLMVWAAMRIEELERQLQLGA